jgi:hypothetical protein
MSYDNPVGKAQQVVLNILGIKVYSFQQADEAFRELGIVVASKRVGRSSVPVVKFLRSGSLMQSEDGDYGTPSVAQLTAEQRAALAQFTA